ncbi:MAG: adenosylmethionine--8-amino-7-oxononanoate transaminase [Pseudomonadota bacterium]
MRAPPEWFKTGLDHIWIPYAQMKTMPTPAPIASTHGTELIMPDGRRLIDGVGSWWTCVHGYNHPALLNAATEQLKQMPHIMLGGIAHEQAYRLAARLAALTPGDLSRVFFSESGSVSVEVAMKIAVQYWTNAHGQQRSKFVAFNGGYHGDTFATMSVCDPAEGMHKYFAGALADQHMVDLPTTDIAYQTLDRLLTEDHSIAAILVEPLIQGAGGMRMHSPAVLQALRQLCDAHGVLLIFDEIFTGFGRTGELFAAQTAAVTPDIMTLGKALTGGITPLAATIASEQIYAAFHDDDESKALMHGPTFTGHAVGCAVANASIDLFESEPRLQQVRALESGLREGLARLANDPRVDDVRVCGAVAAVETVADFDIHAARQWFIDEGVFIRPLGRVIYLSPSYTIEPGDLARLTDAICRFIETRPVS